MDSYDPDCAPDTGLWLDLDEDERLSMILASIRPSEPLPNRTLHAAIHLIVENQIALGDEVPVAGVLARLLAEGLGRHDAVHAVGSVLSTHIHHAMQPDSDRSLKELSLNEAYYRDLAKLSAIGWRRSR